MSRKKGEDDKKLEIAELLLKSGIVRNGPGRPPKLPEVRDELLALIGQGVKPDIACEEVGISRRTLLEWKTNGRDAAAAIASGYDITETETYYLHFLHDFLRAQNRLQKDLELQLRKKLPELSGRDLLEALGRLDRVRWARKDSITHTVESTDANQVAFERYADTFAFALRATFREMGLTTEQQEEAVTHFREQLASVTTRQIESGE